MRQAARLNAECSPHKGIFNVPSFPAERPDVLYSLVAVDFLPPSVINTTLHKVAAQLAAGVLRPLRQISHSMGSVASAFRQMIQASGWAGFAFYALDIPT